MDMLRRDPTAIVAAEEAADLEVTYSKPITSVATNHILSRIRSW